MRSLRLRLLAATGGLLAVLMAIPNDSIAQGESASFESWPGLYAAAELGLGGRPLYQKLFPNGWPTTKDFRRMALEEGDGAFADSVGAVLGSGRGVPLDVSTYERFTFTQRQNEEKGKAPGNVQAHVAQRFEAFAKEANLQNKPEGFVPVFLPYSHSAPLIQTAFDETK